MPTNMTDIQPDKYARVEEERRFHLNILPKDLEKETFTRIVDDYLPGTSLRLRRIETPSGEVLVCKFGQKYRKPGQPPHQTMMTNIYLNENEYQCLSNLGGHRLVKRRHQYAFNDLPFSIDLFEGILDGLILAEIESQAHTRVMDLPMPSFAVQEVTGQHRFSGASLASLTKKEFNLWRKTWAID